MLKTEKSLKELLDELVLRYETKEFIKNDPIQFPHRYKKVEDIEISAFLASIFAFGTRKVFIAKLEQLFSLMEESPYQYIMQGEFQIYGLNYRFLKENDIISILKVLHLLYTKHGGLANLFQQAHQSKDLMQYVCDFFYKNAEQTAGFCFAIPNPAKGGAMKRMYMFLRWLVRKSEVDLGIWRFISPSELKIPMDVHVGRISRELGILKRNSNDKKAVEELMTVLRTFDFNDPVKYDFALFGYGVTHK